MSTKSMGPGEPLTLDAMAERLGWEDQHEPEEGRVSERSRRLLEYLKARQRQSGKRLLLRRGVGHGTRYRVSEPILRRHCPELFGSNVDELQKNLWTHLRAIDEKIERRAGEVARETVLEEVEPRLRQLWQRDEKIAKGVLELMKRVDSLAGQ